MMARASRIYIVKSGVTILAAFTVKHECKSYVESRTPWPLNTMVLIYADGRSGLIHEETLADFMEWV
jgi:hypothetical protein